MRSKLPKVRFPSTLENERRSDESKITKFGCTKDYLKTRKTSLFNLPSFAHSRQQERFMATGSERISLLTQNANWEQYNQIGPFIGLWATF